MSGMNELRERLVQALDMSVVSDGPSACYVDATGNQWDWSVTGVLNQQKTFCL